MVMGAATVDLPAIVLSAGPMLDGWWNGKLAGSGTIVWESRRLLSEGKIDLEEFMSRVCASAPSLGHVLPDGFHRIRHYGLMASAGRKANIAKIRAMVGAASPTASPEASAEPVALTLREPCPCCGGPMRVIEIFRRGQEPRSRAPPRNQAA